MASSISYCDKVWPVTAGCTVVSSGRRRMGLRKERNGNWKGGKYVTSHGYIRVLAPEHPAADSKGYVYEHRLVAEAILSRALVAGEIVHHIDGDKRNNAPVNIQIVTGNANHLVRHRKCSSSLRLPGEDNPIVNCACGCGQQFLHYDQEGRPRRFISGHNPPLAPTRNAILTALAQGRRTRQELVIETGIPLSPLATALSKLTRSGFIFRPSRAVYALVDQKEVMPYA